jgi:hypothetical protein
MNVVLVYGGWFQCRLATDPDPADEPRGVSGYVYALAGEPDLDRVLRLQQAGTVRRPFCPAVGVTVRSVVVNGRTAGPHPLLGAAVNLLDDPVFEGRNGIVADDGLEPIVPFHLQIARDRFVLRRTHVDFEQFPFTELKANGVQMGTTDIGDATGIWDLWDIWQERKGAVDAALEAATDDVTRANLEARSRFLIRRGLTRFFPARMMYAIPLTGTAMLTDPDHYLGGDLLSDPAPWFAELWLGGWDPDALCGYLHGSLAFEVGPARGARPVAADTALAGFAPTSRTVPRRP